MRSEMIRVGDTLTRAPTFYGTKDMLDASPRPCRVVYIHPELRFYVVEFRSTVTGETWRETFYFPNRPELIARPGWGPRLPGARG